MLCRSKKIVCCMFMSLTMMGLVGNKRIAEGYSVPPPITCSVKEIRNQVAPLVAAAKEEATTVRQFLAAWCDGASVSNCVLLQKSLSKVDTQLTGLHQRLASARTCPEFRHRLRQTMDELLRGAEGAKAQIYGDKINLGLNRAVRKAAKDLVGTVYEIKLKLNQYQ